HPTIEDYCVIGLGSTVLGPVTIGRHSRVGAGSVVVQSVPPHSTVVGVPGRVVSEHAPHSKEGAPLLNLDHAQLPDPLLRTLNSLAAQINRLERELAALKGEGGDQTSAEQSAEQQGAEESGPRAQLAQK